MRTGLRGLVGVTTGAAVVLTLGAGPASAERVTVVDRRGDVLKVEEGATSGVPAPGSTFDVWRSSFDHTADRVAARVRFDDLRPTGKRLKVWVSLRDGRGRIHYVGVEAVPGDRGGSASLMGNAGQDRPCKIRHRIDYARDAVRVSLPSACVGSPRVLRFGVLTEHVRRSWRYAWLDDALSPTVGKVTWTRPLAAG
ncbi:MAG TPA: hypothetical protein VFV40_10840 [Nocardioides sp.]|nr:hypothetical protein [Nocardioides sp.]